MTEKQLEAKLREAVIKLKGSCLKFISPSMAGVPDRIILLPGGRLYFVEVKKPKGGKVSPAQHNIHAYLNSLGFPVTVIWTVADLQKFIAYISL